VEAIKTFHERERGWRHIGYHYVANSTGLYKTLPISAVPVCVRGHNVESVCIALAGDWSQGVPAFWKTPEGLAVMQKVAQVAKEILKAYPRVKLVRHRDLVATECPGVLTWDMVLSLQKEVWWNA
jgi:hypothetical protein